MKYIIGLIVAFILLPILVLINIPEFLCGWFCCAGFYIGMLNYDGYFKDKC